MGNLTRCYLHVHETHNCKFYHMQVKKVYLLVHTFQLIWGLCLKIVSQQQRNNALEGWGGTAKRSGQRDTRQMHPQRLIKGTVGREKRPPPGTHPPPPTVTASTGHTQRTSQAQNWGQRIKKTSYL